MMTESTENKRQWNLGSLEISINFGLEINFLLISSYDSTSEKAAGKSKDNI